MRKGAQNPDGLSTMTTSPAWLTIALTSLAATSDSPEAVLASGIRSLPTPHVLHHLNRWARHVWRPAVTPRSLSALTRAPAREPLQALGSGAVSLLAALVEAVKRCSVSQWIDVLGVMFLADDPWTIEVGRNVHAESVDLAAAAMRTLYENVDMTADVAGLFANRLDVKKELLHDFEVGTSAHDESFAELRCRVAALQLQLDDVTAVVRRNEKNTKDLLSSFHFWSLLLLDELRSYRKQERGERSGSGAGGDGQDGILEMFPKSIAQLINRPGTASAAGGSASESIDSSILGSSEGTSGTGASGGTRMPKGGKLDGQRSRRVFRDGKWVNT